MRELVEEEFAQFKLRDLFLTIYGRSQTAKLLGEKRLTMPGTNIFTFSQTEDIDTQYEELKANGCKVYS